MHQILIVCNGNIHRSVIAEYCVNQILKKYGLNNEIAAISRGLAGTGGIPGPKYRRLCEYEQEWSITKPVLEELGIDPVVISKHQNTPITLEDVEQAAIIIAMDRLILSDLPHSLAKQFPQHQNKMRLFLELEGKCDDVPDCGGSKDVQLHRRVNTLIYRVIMERIVVLLSWMANKTNGGIIMKKISRIPLNGDKQAKQEAREKLASTYDSAVRIAENNGLMSLLEEVALSQLDRKVKHGVNLTFEEAMVGMSYVLAATNVHFFEVCQNAFSKAHKTNFSPEKALPIGTAFLQLMAVKESLKALTPEEVAGIAAASLMDTVIRLDLSRVVETCGMGGDKGLEQNNETYKTINCSTLSALVLGALGLPVIKHGSYANTSAIGSTEAIELFGAKTVVSSEREISAIWQKCGFCYLDAHLCKTIHDLSHLLMMETINHIAGPMSLPVSRATEINKIMGVNEKIHPETVAKAYTVLHQKKQQNMGGVVIICGLDEIGRQVDPVNYSEIKEHTILDEMSPYVSVVSVAYQDKFLGTHLLKPEDFGIEIKPTSVQIINTKEAIHKANCRTLKGEDAELVKYLAMNAAMGLFAERYLSRGDAVNKQGLNRELLRSCFRECYEVISSGKVWDFLIKYVEATGGQIPCSC